MSWSEKIKNESKELRLKGKSFTDITRLLHVPKSTLSSWLSDIERPNRFKNQVEFVKFIKE